MLASSEVIDRDHQQSLMSSTATGMLRWNPRTLNSPGWHSWANRAHYLRDRNPSVLRLVLVELGQLGAQRADLGE